MAQLWGGRFTKETDQLVYNFNASISFDQKFYKQDIAEEITALTVESVERENNYVTINGGIEEGGIDLCKEDDHYRTLTWDDFPAYYEVGVAKQLVMADDIELSDGAADFEADPVIVKGDRTVCDAMSNEEDAYGWNAGNTTVTIQNGEITRADRIWVP